MPVPADLTGPENTEAETLTSAAAEQVGPTDGRERQLILRILWLAVSATYTLPGPSTATPNGWSKLAAVPVASVDPFEPDSASVVTTPFGVIVRIL